MTDPQTIRRLAKVEQHLEDVILHLDAAADEAGFMIADDYDRIFGGAMGSGGGSTEHVKNNVHAMMRCLRRHLAKLEALEKS